MVTTITVQCGCGKKVRRQLEIAPYDRRCIDARVFETILIHRILDCPLHRSQYGAKPQ